MGIVKSITHSYTYNEYLYWYIERNDVPHIEEILQKKPAIINERLTVSYVTTPLHRAAVNGNLKLVQMFIEKYSAAVDLPTDSGETALIGAVKRNHVQVVEYLIKAKANTNFVSKCGLSVSDYAILAGLYPIALLLSHYIGKEQYRTPSEYQEIAKKHKYRYVNYTVFLDCLREKTKPQETPDFLTKERVVLTDPVVDPREPWRKWILRNLQFKDPPLVERSELPEELQPQNRRFGKIRHFFSRSAMSPLSQKPSLYPETVSQIGLQDYNRQAKDNSCANETKSIS